ncbi:GNAT family N-acetyltransferase [Actinoplanes sp. LDG1-06]|uniref:GNAT family N-acetyltransferase n=1 Tax=Paractinoplanes ovalisporus TaxID=2810368 RepID=A0ABS2A7Q9_9ACTN|nr:GNAT family N-acetyltransferase [Actinoplanes ovalisporus]MBM2615353.1 GNAT family N-acetyltransferase [Actinoplanes ovalisporus]
MPLATDPGFLGRRWTGAGVVAFGVRGEDGSLLAAGAVRGATSVGGAAAGSGSGGSGSGGALAGVGSAAVFTGLVDPSARGRGLGAALLDRGLALAGEGDVTVETETLTDDAVELFESRGLRQSFAEDVMRIDDLDLPAPVWPDGVTLSTWDEPVSRRFHTTYHASFRDRPGFPADPADVWIAENEEDDDFLPSCSLLVTLPDLGDAGFVVAAQGWIVQAGVVPFARRRGLAAALITESLTRMRADGADHCWLTVNVNNPGAAALYRRLGFAQRGRRARYQR